VTDFRVAAWVPRGLEDSIGPVATVVARTADDVVEEVDCEVRAHGAKHEVNGRSVGGARIEMVFSLVDGANDETAWNTANDVVVRAVNRVLHLAAFAGKNQKHFRTLQVRDFHDIAVFDLTNGERPVSGERPVERNVTIRGTGLTQRTQVLLDVPAARRDSEALWFDALESAFERRVRDAVVAARAAVEVAWKSAVQRVRNAHTGLKPQVAAMVEALVDAAIADSVPLPQKLDKHSAPIFGSSFKDRWNEKTWDRVSKLLFKARNRGAHGSGEVTEEDAHRAVEIARAILDDIEFVCDSVERGQTPPASVI
jgi:hypothetical protein